MKSNQVIINRILKDGLENHRVNKIDKAELSYRKALRLDQNNVIALKFLGEICQNSNRYSEAIKCFKKVVDKQSDDLEVWSNYMQSLQADNRSEDLQVALSKFILLFPENAKAFYVYGTVLYKNKQFGDALEKFMKVIDINNKSADPYFIGFNVDNCDAFIGMGQIFKEIGMPSKAASSYKFALMANPSRSYVMSKLIESKHLACEWSEYYENNQYLVELVRKGEVLEDPFAFLNITSSGVDQLICSDMKVSKELVISNIKTFLPSSKSKIQIAYASADFYNHATVALAEKLFCAHDRDEFEVIGISLSNKTDHVTQRLKKVFDAYYDVSYMSDKEIAEYIVKLDVDILVDLKGYTADSKIAIFSYHPAPVQVSYLGFPGSMGREFIDYIIGDYLVTPMGCESYYGEKIVRLPGSYQINNNEREISLDKGSKVEHGLPTSGFVFCCFNNNYKITPQIFDIWMRLLSAVQGSVLWLLAGNNDCEINLKKEAVNRGVDGERLVFAPRAPIAKHLARHCHADLFLDTLPINAHTTASDALWAGLPVITCTGEAFASRVAASLLNAVGLPELITSNYAEYEELALRLATEPELIALYKKNLIDNRLTCDLFNTEKTTRHLEEAYRIMHSRRQSGLQAGDINLV